MRGRQRRRGKRRRGNRKYGKYKINHLPEQLDIMPSLLSKHQIKIFLNSENVTRESKSKKANNILLENNTSEVQQEFGKLKPK